MITRRGKPATSRDGLMQSKVYFNVRKKKFSVLVNGKVRDHVDFVDILNPTFKVSEAGRQRVLKQKRKNVHAFVVGEVVSEPDRHPSKRVTYNPYLHSSFVEFDNQDKQIHQANFARLRVGINGKPTIFVD